jgi:hypothetical protein
MLIVNHLNGEKLSTYTLDFLTVVTAGNHHFLFLGILGGV